jgi:hypothetical protein
MYNFAVIYEFGNADLASSKDRVSSHFILTAILFKEESFDYIESELEIIREKYFQTGEMKSSKIKNDKRRNIVLNQILKLPIKVYSLVCNKEFLFSKGFQYRKSFYKYLHKQLYKDLFFYYPNIKIIADEIGSSEFMKEFKDYIIKNSPNDLFEQSHFNFRSSKEFIPIQCADVICGSIARAYDDIYKDVRTNLYIKLLKDSSKLLAINHWPIEDIREHPSIQSKKFDEEISKIILAELNIIISFLSRDEKSDNYILQCKTLDYLLMEYLYGEENRYISANEIISHLCYLSEEELSKNYFRTNIIGKIRDYGIIIATSSNGYKLPSNINDISDYLDHNKSIIIPMLKRLLQCQKTISVATEGALDIFDIAQYKQLGNIAEALKDR